MASDERRIVQIELTAEERDQLARLGGSEWVSRQLAVAFAAPGPLDRTVGRDAAYAKWHNKRRENLLAKQEDSKLEMIAEGFSNSPATANAALFSAMKQMDYECSDKGVWDAGWAACTEGIEEVLTVEEAVLAEREACARVCDARYMGDNNREDMEARRCAAAIRARNQKETS